MRDERCEIANFNTCYFLRRMNKVVLPCTLRMSDCTFVSVSCLVSVTMSRASSDASTYSTALRSADLTYQGPDSVINYLLDDVSLTEVAEDTNWKEEANARIEQVRKGNIHIR